MKSASELILNSKGNVYHLDLPRESITPICITVGDPERVTQVSKHFDTIEFRQAHREFVTHVGTLHGKRIMVISTGISTDNIDIVFNELDALANIDLKTGMPLDVHQTIQFIRIGTAGSFSPQIPVDELLINSYAFGLDSLMRFYPEAVIHPDPAWYYNLNPECKVLFKDAYLGIANETLYRALKQDFYEGITITCPGFYGAQGRTLRLRSLYTPSLFELLPDLDYHGYRFTNFEMETAGIYGMATALGHQAVSVNVILANRALGTFSTDANTAIESGIKKVMARIAEL